MKLSYVKTGDVAFIPYLDFSFQLSSLGFFSNLLNRLFCLQMGTSCFCLIRTRAFVRKYWRHFIHFVSIGSLQDFSSRIVETTRKSAIVAVSAIRRIACPTRVLFVSDAGLCDLTLLRVVLLQNF